ncbi:TadE/TadG family type IV pilus assembly protein [Propionicicella superfundia]|uniref:TadE/TadG family type IV pilus assembly protein n=1 Tax=Propionicicella superfundia TaxID=348582 RepID=UPI00041BD022|nr:TadE/TadG family type IV pilus assembly protein [Propionicicella superfundia]
MSMSVELVIVVPVLIVLLGVVAGGGRYWHARTTVERAAASAARAATLQRSASAAEAAARLVATTELDGAGVGCGSRDVAVDTSGFAVPVGRPATVTVAVACHVSFGGLIVPGRPGTIVVAHSASSVLDRYRGRHA